MWLKRLLKYCNKTVLLIFFCTTSITAQNNWMVKGYVKELISFQNVLNDNDIVFENTVHNRFDSNWFINENLTLSAGLRNRIIIGDNLSSILNYNYIISRDAGLLDLSYTWVNNKSWIGVSQFDRLSIDYTIGKWQFTVGRQRINWGQSFVWNPNDLFNAYSYFDFDYEEKPGTDAIRLQYYMGASRKIEWSTAFNKERAITSAFLYRFNTHGFDIQFLTGVHQSTDYVIGTGWSGSIKGGGFNGELSYYHPFKLGPGKRKAITAVMHYDYTFKNSLQLQFETLFNGFGRKDFATGLNELLIEDVTAKNLFPTKFAVFGSGGYRLSPLVTVLISGIYGPRGNFIYFGPSFTYSISDNMILDLIGQYFSTDSIDSLTGNRNEALTIGSSIYLRLKWSF
jgi:hypothetical protein